MSGFRYTPHAKRHLIDIWEYSVSRWGERRAEGSPKAINESIAMVAAGSEGAVPANSMGPI